MTTSMHAEASMHRKLVLFAVLCLALAACTPTKEATYAAHGADVVSTGVGLALGAAEANPLGIVALPIKLAMVEYAGSLPPDEQPAAYATLSAVTWGAVANNICIIASIATAGAFSPACPVIGVVTGLTYWDATKTRREGPRLYAYCAEPAHGAASDCKAHQ